MKYEKLVKSLRWCSVDEYVPCTGCPMDEETHGTGCFNIMHQRAAAAIEALEDEVKRLKECLDELREAQTYIDHYGDKWMTSAKDVPTSAYNHGYMDGKYEALTLEECIDRLHELGWLQEHDRILTDPKRGEWVGVSPFVDSEQCSICGYCIHSEELETPYCPWCGAKMEVQDGQK